MISIEAGDSMKTVWEKSFEEQIARGAYNTAAVEALARCVSYYLRDRDPNGNYSDLHFLEMGCGAGPNLIWLAQKGIQVSGIDIAPNALTLCRRNLQKAGCDPLVRHLIEASVDQVPLEDQSVDGILESCVFQHLDRPTRLKAFAEVRRLLRPGGLFVGYMLAEGHTVYQKRKDEEDPRDPGTLFLHDGKSNFYLTNIGLSHFFRSDEYHDLLQGFRVIDPCLTTYVLPQSEARKRGYDPYVQAMWTVYAIK